jgi:hypothetical protein
MSVESSCRDTDVFAPPLAQPPNIFAQVVRAAEGDQVEGALFHHGLHLGVPASGQFFRVVFHFGIRYGLRLCQQIGICERQHFARGQVPSVRMPARASRTQA